ncbi:hypothetical protein PR202_gb09344 [Eleusine coracana subsp. coracana]|uniref:BHLH domain-containing protein n=1 Tax=Eleusine coracana subsp. coracana TaxID=191504 RepID=A0AAV5EGH3_ELECO|nr:hypothetical protein PR202_gb09344 [Eleusine coracana subsp. coracana]
MRAVDPSFAPEEYEETTGIYRSARSPGAATVPRFHLLKTPLRGAAAGIVTSFLSRLFIAPRLNPRTTHPISTRASPLAWAHPSMAGALPALCRAGGWSYAAIWRSDRRDPRLLTIGECHYEDEARKVVERMVNQVHVVGEGVIGSTLISGECQWISDDTHFSLSQTSDADNLGLFQVSKSFEFLDQVKGTFFLRESISWHPSTEDIQKSVPPYNMQVQLNSLSTTEGHAHIKAEPENPRLQENTMIGDSLKNITFASSNQSFSDGFTSFESCSGLNPHIVAMPVNSKTISAVKVLHNVSDSLHNNTSENTLLNKFSKQAGSHLTNAATPYSSLNSLPRIEHGLGPNKLHHCPESGKPSSFRDSYSSFFSMDAELKPTIFDNVASTGQSAVIREVDTAGSTSHACELQELPNEIWGETAAAVTKQVIKGDNENNDVLESTIFDPVMHDWWDGAALLAGNISHLDATTTNSATERGNSDALSAEDRGLFSESIFEELLGFGGNVGSIVTSAPVADSVSSYQLPQYNLEDPIAGSKAHIPSLTVPSSSCTAENVQIGTKTIPMSLGSLSMDDSCSLNTANSKVSQAKKPEGIKAIKKRARPGESTRPRPKDRQQIQERVKELREIVPNSAKCSIDALLDRTIKHMLFLQSVTKYAEKIKQADEPKMISKDSGAVLNDKSSGVVLKDDPSAGSNGGATWAYEVAGQTMVSPIIVEDLTPPGQMLVEMLCEERGFFLEIADTIRGFGLTILKGLMELRDGKIMARFLVEANKNVTRMDIFLSLVQLLQQNSLNRSSEQLTKVISNGVPSFAEHQQSPISIPVGLAGR